MFAPLGALPSKMKPLATGGGSGAWSPAPGINAFESMIPGQQEVSDELFNSIVTALQGQFPEEYFQSSIAGPMRTEFEEDIAPAVRQEFVGPGTYWGGARASEVTSKRGKMETDISARRTELAYQTRLQALQSALTYLGIPLMATYQPYNEKVQVGNNALWQAIRKIRGVG